jgi:hypothetical protein
MAKTWQPGDEVQWTTPGSDTLFCGRLVKRARLGAGGNRWFVYRYADDRRPLFSQRQAGEHTVYEYRLRSLQVVDQLADIARREERIDEARRGVW